jgi:hypothetical protein
MRRKYTITNDAGEKIALYNDIENVIEILADHISGMIEVGTGYYPVLINNPTLREMGGKKIIEN